MIWDRRIQRAEDLAREIPAAAEILALYQHLARFQQTVAQANLPAESALSPYLQPLLALVQRVAPAPLAKAALELSHRNPAWDDLAGSPNPIDAIFGRILLQPYTEALARRGPVSTSVQPLCPFCGEKPVAAVLRPAGDGGKRSLLCWLCFTEWEFRRLLCPHCGEEDKDQLPIYTAQQVPHIRVEACDNCRVYLKAIDLTKNGLAVPEVDELASVALDIWAAENGYTKLQGNLFGL
jgi:FdhE protein